MCASENQRSAIPKCSTRNADGGCQFCHKLAARLVMLFALDCSAGSMRASHLPNEWRDVVLLDEFICRRWLFG